MCIYSVYIYIHIYKNILYIERKKQSSTPKSTQLTRFLTPLQALLQSVLQKHMPRHVRGMRSGSKGFDPPDRVFVVVVVVKARIEREEVKA